MVITRKERGWTHALGEWSFSAEASVMKRQEDEVLFSDLIKILSQWPRCRGPYMHPHIFSTAAMSYEMAFITSDQDFDTAWKSIACLACRRQVSIGRGRPT